MQQKIIAAIGGTGALGRSVTEAFLREGDTVIVGWNSSEKWEAYADDFAGCGDRLTGIPVDVTSESSVQEYFDAILQRFGRVDALVYMAGVFAVGPELWHADIPLLRRLIEINTIGAVTACKYAIPPMLEQNRGNIFFLPAKSVLYGTPHFGAYAVSKGALLTLMDTLTAELIDTDIAVNCVMPDAMLTPITKSIPNAPTDKMVTTEDVAEVIVSACRSRGNIIRGSVLRCFGK